MMKDVVSPTESMNKLFQTIATPTPEKPVVNAVVETESSNEDENFTEESKNSNDFVTDDYVEATTEAALALLDSVNTTVFEILANAKLEKRVAQIEPENGFGKLLDLKAKKEAESTIVLSSKEAQLLDVDAKVKAFIEKLPFSEATKKTMLPGLRVVIQKNAGEIPPEFWLVTGLATAVGANIAELRRL